MLNYLKLWKWRRHLKQGDHVLVHVSKKEAKKLKIVLPPGDGEVTVFHPENGHQSYRLSKIYPLSNENQQ